jgi:uncharacterized protein (TIGR03437 family)
LRAAWAQAPAYTADSIVNASNYTSGPFAPNSVLSIFGYNLSWSTAWPAFNAIASYTFPTQLAGVQVYIDNSPAPLLYVSGSQINFIVPDNQISGDVTFRVAREGVSGPEVTVALVDAAPQLFDNGAGYALATHGDGALLTDASPAHGGEIIVVYATGMGATEPNPSPGGVPQSAAPLVWLASLSVSLDGAVLPSFRIKYAGATPLSAGLYQINLELPPDVGTDPAIQVAMRAQSSAAGLKIAVK